MKNKLISSIALITLAFQLVACGSTDSAQAAEPSEPAFEAVSETESVKEEETNVAEVSQTETKNFVGQYYAGRGNLSILEGDADDYLIEVWWGSSAAEHSEWVMHGKYDESTNTITYSDCERHDITVNESGEVEIDDTAYTNGTGSIKINADDSITWIDDQDHLADDLPMTK